MTQGQNFAADPTDGGSTRLTNFEDVGDFHEKFNLHNVTHRHLGPTGAENDEALMQFRIKFMEEELQEFILGLQDKDIAQMADALVDLVYVVMGTAHLLGIPWQPLWDDVQRANMAKQRALTDGSDSKRGSSFDVVKPEGWKAPDTWRVLEQHGFSS